MKKLILVLLIMTSSIGLMAQTSNNTELVQKMDELQNAKTFQEFSKLEDDFIDINAHSGKSTWHSLYYAAYTSIQQAKILVEESKMDQVNGYLNTSLKYLSVIDANENVEANALLGITYFLKSNFDTQHKEKFLIKAESYFNKAKALSANNHRVLLLGHLLNGTSYNNVLVEGVERPLEPTWGKADLGKLIKN